MARTRHAFASPAPLPSAELVAINPGHAREMTRAPLPEARANFPFTAYLTTTPPQMSTSARAGFSFMALVRFARKLSCSISSLNFRLSCRFALTDFPRTSRSFRRSRCCFMCVAATLRFDRVLTAQMFARSSLLSKASLCVAGDLEK
jgi:hypothetical protein